MSNIVYEIRPGNSEKIHYSIGPFRAIDISYTIEKADNCFISGRVTNKDIAIEGADVFLIDEVDIVLAGYTLTDSSGNYVFDDLDVDKTYHVTVSYSNGIKYNAESKPFITPVTD